MTAINSHVIRLQARALRDLEPDVVVVYMGNNEVIGPFGPGGAFGRARPAAWVRMQLALRATRIGQGLARLLDRATGRESAVRRWHGLALFERRVPSDDPALRVVYRNFAANLADILASARATGARIALCTVAANERMAPFAPAPGALPDHDAAAQWRAAIDYLAQGHSNLARVAFQRALDLDTLRVRADSRINKVLRDAAADAKDVRLVDAASALGDRADLFLDHVHFTFGGNYQLAHLIADAIAPGPAPDEAEVARALGFDAGAEAGMLRQMLDRFARPPYTRQADHRERVASMRARERALQRERVAPLARAEAIRRAGESRPHDVELAILWGHALGEAGRHAEAARVLARALARVPHHTLAHLALADALAALDKDDLALRHYELGSPLAADPRAEALSALGATLADLGRFADAEPRLRAAVARAPRHALARYNLALLLSRTDRKDAAINAYRALLRIDPGFSEARNNLATLLHHKGRSEEALAELRKVTAEDPDYLPAWRNLAGIAAALGLTNDLAAALGRLRE
jgi:tetratricopeptide (TPR) repeat protein